jgi:hypothetical protein
VTASHLCQVAFLSSLAAVRPHGCDFALRACVSPLSSSTARCVVASNSSRRCMPFLSNVFNSSCNSLLASASSVPFCQALRLSRTQRRRLSPVANHRVFCHACTFALLQSQENGATDGATGSVPPADLGVIWAADADPPLPIWGAPAGTRSGSKSGEWCAMIDVAHIRCHPPPFSFILGSNTTATANDTTARILALN